PPSVVQVCVPHGVRPVARSGLVVCGRRHLEALRHPATLPPRLRVEEAVLDVADACSKPAGVVDVILCVVQRRLTSPDRLAERLSARHRHRWRDLIEDVLADARDGTQSLLERSYLNGVERAHGLPTGVRNAPDQVSPGGARCYRDVRYRRWAVVVELDGLEAHPAERAFRDRSRDNAVVVSGQVSLRYGWREVAGDPCGIASELCRVLRSRGWDGKARPCGPDCTLEVDDRWGSVPHPDADPHR
ncbi:MAG TPA: hypothetical protein VHN80_01470, partial [Kineosporiaceae bacterium]|nr:hypothetical protein [Kineosporiaceae bacterium]